MRSISIQTLQLIFIISIHFGFQQSSNAQDNKFAFDQMTIHRLSNSHSDIIELTKNKKLIFVDFWASWCEPCKQSFPYYSDLYKKHSNDILFVGISLDDETSDAEAFIKKSQPSFPTYIDLKSSSIKKFKIPAIPYLFVLNDQFEIIEKIRGFDKTEKEKIIQLINRKIVKPATP